MPGEFAISIKFCFVLQRFVEHAPAWKHSVPMQTLAARPIRWFSSPNSSDLIESIEGVWTWSQTDRGIFSVLPWTTIFSLLLPSLNLDLL